MPDVSIQDGVDAYKRKDWNTALCFFLALGHSDTVPAIRALAWANVGRIYDELGLVDEAHASWRHAAAIDPSSSPALTNLGCAAVDFSNPEEASRYFRSVLSRDTKDANAWNGLATVEILKGNYAAALPFTERALREDIDTTATHWNRALCLLALGQWEEGWKYYEKRWGLAKLKRVGPIGTGPMLQSIEQGIGKTVLVLTEQGLGDNLMWARCYSQLESLGVRLIIEAYPPLVELMKKQHWGKVIKLSDPFPPHDYQVFLGSLPGMLELSPENDPTPHPYIYAPKIELKRGSKPLVGLTWRGSMGHSNDKNRSAPMTFVPMLMDAIPQVEWCCVQKDEYPPVMMRDMREWLGNFWQSARMFNSLDAVVSVDSAPIHLAGALSIPSVLISPKRIEWRWYRDIERLKSRWYADTTIAPQDTQGDWDSVIPKVVRWANERF